MPALQVRDFPDELYAEFKQLAEREHRSIAQQMIVAAEEMLARRAFADSPFGEGSAAAPSECANLPKFPRDTIPYFDFSTEEERAERIRKRKRIFEEMDRWREEHPMPEFSTEQIVQWIREDRDGRTDAILEASGFPGADVDLHAKGA